MRLRVSSVQEEIIRLQQKQRNGSTHSFLHFETKQLQQNYQYQAFKNNKEMQQQSKIQKVEGEQKQIKINDYTEQQQQQQQQEQQQQKNQQQQQQQQQQSKLQSQQQQQSQPFLYGNFNFDAENHKEIIQMNCALFQQKYNISLEAINLIGQTVAKCLTFFNALQNVWVIPLFLVFKRMLQLRKQVENLLQEKVNSFNINYWEEITQSAEFENYLTKVQQDNQLVQSELSVLLNSAKAKAEKLDKSRRDKVEWFLNDDLENKIKDIYKNIKDKKGIERPNIEWLKLQIQAQASIIISELPIFTYDKDNFTYEGYLSALEFTDEDQIYQYLNKYEHYLDHK
ncbi:unnamed protein product [Paramecium octaurelia]|uniref:Uncharacterized protein n=1 Tax=Paramecium octaurelia TaxID=43137 RepID=A0A8S1WBF5_PAROT|nr:unnamed protein product [Paramecium octaurelia]